MNIGLFLKQLFCDHVDELIENKYLYSTGIHIGGKLRVFYKHYAQTFKCMKCGRTNIISVKVDVL